MGNVKDSMGTMKMERQDADGGDVTIVAVEGDIVGANATKFYRELTRIVQESPRDASLCVNLERTNNIDTFGLQALMRVAKLFPPNQQARYAVVVGQNPIGRLLKLAGLESSLQLQTEEAWVVFRMLRRHHKTIAFANAS